MNDSDLGLLVDWFKDSRRRLKRIEVMVALILSAIAGYLFEPNEYEKVSSIISMMVLVALFYAVKETYIWWNNWRAFRAADKVKEAILRSLEKE